jgi:hypothetical protein
LRGKFAPEVTVKKGVPGSNSSGAEGVAVVRRLGRMDPTKIRKRASSRFIKTPLIAKYGGLSTFASAAPVRVIGE